MTRWLRPWHGSLGVVAILNAGALIGLWDLRALGPPAVAMGVLAYVFGLRHAFDLDHITAIDTVTRALRDGDGRSSAVGLYFSLGHSSVVVMLSLLVATIVRSTSHAMAWLSHVGMVVGTGVSATFLLIMGVTNLSILLRLVRSDGHGGASLRPAPQPGGFLLRALSVFFRVVRRDWQMYFVGILFGLGFDTATEIAVLGISAAMARHGAVSLAQIMVFPLLFTAGMTLLDTLDGLAVARLYDWTVRDPAQRGRLNMVFTGAGVLVALMVSVSEWLQLWGSVQDTAGVRKGFSGVDFSAAGEVFTVLLMAAWLLAWLWNRRGTTARGAVGAITNDAVGAADTREPRTGRTLGADADAS